MITFDVVTNDNPPSADVAVVGLPAGTVNIRVTRLWRGVASRPRGDDFATVVGDSARIVDSDVPTSTNVVYRVEAIDVSGAVLETALSPSIFIDHGDPCTIWLSDPLAPPLTTRVTVYSPTDEVRSYPAQIAAIYAMGDPTPYAQGQGARSRTQGWEWMIVAPDRDTSDRLDDLLESGNVLVVRPHPDAIRHRTGIIFLAIPDVSESPDHSTNTGESVWLLSSAFEAQDARLPVVMVEHDYGAASGEAATYGAYAALYSNYLAAARG